MVCTCTHARHEWLDVCICVCMQCNMIDVVLYVQTYCASRYEADDAYLQMNLYRSPLCILNMTCTCMRLCVHASVHVCIAHGWPIVVARPFCKGLHQGLRMLARVNKSLPILLCYHAQHAKTCICLHSFFDDQIMKTNG